MTRPLSLPPSCTLWIDGERYADGQPGEADTSPVALDDLSVVWGRSTTVDQPAPATATFRVLDVGGGERFTDRLHVGAGVLVRADATIYPDPTESVVIDPSFEAAPVGSVPSTAGTNGRAVVSSTRAATGARSVRVDPVDAGRMVRVIFPPAPFSTDPAAWDGIPRTLLGQSWRYGATVWVPHYLATVLAAAVVRPVTFTAPTPAAATVGTETATWGPPNAGLWRVHTGTLTPTAADRWVGVAVDFYPTGPAWDDVPAGVTWDALGAVPAWDDVAAAFVDDIVVLAPAAGAGRSGAVFHGRVTDMTAAYDEGIGGTIVTVTAQGDTAEIANRYIGDTVWNAETLGTRFGRIITATIASGQGPLTYVVDPSAAGAPVTYRDVDSQSALTLMQELAASVGGVLWSATHLTTGPYLRLEDVNQRPPLQVLEMVGGVVVIVPAPVIGATGITVDACDVLLSPVRWVQDGTDSATQVDVLWLEQTVDAGVVKPTQRTASAVDAPAELATGRRRVAVSTQLSTAPAAETVADALLGRLSAGGWRVSGLTYEVRADDQLTPAKLAGIMRILDGTTRLGLPVMLTNLPDWSPVPAGVSVPLYVEGSRLSNTAGAWTLELVTSSAKAQGAGAVAWDDLPADWSWDEFDPSITWNQLNGVGI